MAWLAEFSTEAQGAEERGAPRRRLQLSAQAVAGRGNAADVLIHNLSTSGLLLETAAPLTQGEAITVALPEAGATDATIIWQRSSFYGCRFGQPIPAAALSAAQLRSSWFSTPADQVAADEDLSKNFSPRRRIAIIVGAAMASWTFVAVIAWIAH